jgi:dihydrofolate synthase/folylpolyglutamate synthase
VCEDPPVVLDGAHNPQAAAVLARAVTEAWPDPASRPMVLIGVLSDKDAEGIVRELAPVAGGFVCTSPASDRALSADEMARVVEGVTGTPCATVSLSDVDRAWAAHAARGGGLLVTGSLYTVGQVRSRLIPK